MYTLWKKESLKPMTSMFTVKNQRQKSKLNPRKPRQEIKADIHQIEDRKQLINESRSWFFDKIKKIDKPVARIIESPRYQKQERWQNSRLHWYHKDKNDNFMLTSSTTEMKWTNISNEQSEVEIIIPFTCYQNNDECWDNLTEGEKVLFC